MNLIRPDTIAFKAVVSEEELKRRMEDEVLAQCGGLDAEGKRLKGITIKTNRGTHGGYTIEVSGPTPQHFLVALAAPSTAPQAS